MFSNIEDYPFLEPFKENWEGIKREFELIQKNQQVVIGEDHIHNHGWSTVFFLYKGEYYKENLQQCPLISSLIKNVPNLARCFFSVMKPGCIIYPHSGAKTPNILRSHLGIICPKGATITVGDSIKRWIAGEMLVFNDSITHSARNLSCEERVVLIVDFIV
jgi:beta-hydroxylase